MQVLVVCAIGENQSDRQCCHTAHIQAGWLAGRLPVCSGILGAIQRQMFTARGDYSLRVWRYFFLSLVCYFFVVFCFRGAC